MVARLRLAIYAPCPFWPSRRLRLGDVGSARARRMGGAEALVPPRGLLGRAGGVLALRPARNQDPAFVPAGTPAASQCDTEFARARNQHRKEGSPPWLRAPGTAESGRRKARRNRRRFDSGCLLRQRQPRQRTGRSRGVSDRLGLRYQRDAAASQWCTSTPRVLPWRQPGADRVIRERPPRPGAQPTQA